MESEPAPSEPALSLRRAGNPPPRIQIEAPAPLIDSGRYAAKACVGDVIDVRATIFRDGHDIVRAVVRHRGPRARRWLESPMARIDADIGGDTWEGEFEVTEQGRWRWSIEAWTDAFSTWRDELERKLGARQRDVSSELSEGVVLLEEIALRARGADRKLIKRAVEQLGDEDRAPSDRRAVALDRELANTCARYPDRTNSALMARPVEVDVDRLRARFGSWYELFPRSWGGFAGVREQLPRLAELGFDVVYLPPIHPIGVTNRKGPNNALKAGAQDPGSPWAIGSAQGGHTAVDPELGTLEDFDALVETARDEHGIEIAIDFAAHCSADHPWLTEHPEWFHHRPDGTLKYAENPPKRYQDIYNVNFECEEWLGLWEALKGVIDFWVDHGVRVFRVDNPHTKPVAFWEWLIGEVRARVPDVIFLAEAFTRAAMMRTLAKVGFNQSYTYFAWKNSRRELSEYVNELAYSEMREYYRPNFFANTPDILSEYLQEGGPAAFAVRLLLAGTLSPSYGIYSGFAGSEEYLDSEKYEIKSRALDGPLLPMVGRVNALRREHVSLQRLDNVTFLETENEALIAYAKRTGRETLFVIVNLDPHVPQEGVTVVPYEFGTAPAFGVLDLLSGERFGWNVGRNYVRLDPAVRAGHILVAEPPR
jgi:starch synthase (maltosyl-transferring)